MKRLAWTFGLCAVLLLGFAAVPPAGAQETEDTAEAEARAKAREERIQEYLRKKEERRLRREAEQTRKEEESAARQTAEALEGGSAAPEPEKRATGKSARRERPQRSALPRRLARLHEQLAASAFGQDPTVAPYMELIAAGEASAQQIAAFGNFLGQAGRSETALAYYDLALSLDSEDPTIWVNAGTLQRQAGNLQAAAAAYAEALGIDPSHAYAHYNLGAVLDEMGEYDSAIEEYKLALMLDPDLGDPAFNPQAANNEKLIAVRLMLYKEQSGSLGLPLVTVPRGEVNGGN